MLGKLVKIFVGSRNERLIKKKNKVVQSINDLSEEYRKLSDEDLKAKTGQFKERVQAGETLEDILPEAFATVREAAFRVLEMRHFDVQLIGAMVLNDGRIAEMKTGEGKTLMATCSAYLNALSGKGVHVITVNDYLAQRDAATMGRLYDYLGLTTGVITNDLPPAIRREAYGADITYGTNNEFGFDYLRDNMAFKSDQKVQRELNYAIIDEVDSILIDEARTPLIISGPTDDQTDLYQQLNEIVPVLTRKENEEDEDASGDYTVDEKARQVFLTEEGHEHIERLMVEHNLMEAEDSLYSATNIRLMHYTNAALRAHVLFQRDVDYIVKDDQVVIVDEFTGRTMPGRRWSDGLHQAIEAKEGVTIQNENQTLASITFQNYFRLYNKLSGMTGTADTEAFEFQHIYGLEVVVIPTHRPMIRDDRGDLIYLSTREKFDAIVEDIKDCSKRKQPVLVGTTSIESSEYLSNLLKKQKINHQVLNAKFHEQEANIIAQAGKPGAVTIATNMAGRGTDIVLGGNYEKEIEAAFANPEKQQALKAEWQALHKQVVEAGGLHVVGSERHESRRVDNQLRGRSGRQGDPGSTRFYLSMEDNLMRIFAPERTAGLMQKLGMEDGEAIEHPLVTRAIENAQRKVEGRNFDIRKELLEYDNVANEQRKIIYEQRNKLMATDDISETVKTIRDDVLQQIINQSIPPQSIEEQWDIPGLEEALAAELGIRLEIQAWLDADNALHEETLREKIAEELNAQYLKKSEQVGAEVMRHLEKSVMLQVLDNDWKEHLSAMDHLRRGIHLRGYAQKDPKQEYKREAFQMFNELLNNVKVEVISILSKIELQAESDVQALDDQRQVADNLEFQHQSVSAMEGSNEVVDVDSDDSDSMDSDNKPYTRDGRKVRRNEPCPCGSGKKYKQCCGRV